MEALEGKKSRGGRLMRLGASVLICLSAALCFWFQPDWLAAVTLAT